AGRSRGSSDTSVASAWIPPADAPSTIRLRGVTTLRHVLHQQDHTPDVVRARQERRKRDLAGDRLSAPVRRLDRGLRRRLAREALPDRLTKPLDRQTDLEVEEIGADDLVGA